MTQQTQPIQPTDYSEEIKKAKKALRTELLMEEVAMPVSQLDAINNLMMGTPVGIGSVDGRTGEVNAADIVDSILSGEVSGKNIRGATQTAQSNGSKNVRYYCQKNAMMWQGIFEAVHTERVAKFIDAAAVQLSINTLHMQANYALKWLCEMSQPAEERRRWCEIRVAMMFKRVNTSVQKGLLVCNKLRLIMADVAVNVNTDKILTPENIKRISEHNQSLINAAKGVVHEIEANERKQWQGRFYVWTQQAKAGDMFVYDPAAMGSPYKFTPADETWFLEFITDNNIPVMDYKFRFEENRLEVAL